MTDPVLLVERRGPVAVLTLNRPAARNAVNSALAARLGRALELLDSDPELRVGVLAGAGPAFCAGADLKALAAGEAVHDPEHPEWGFAGITHHPLRKPLVAAVEGAALGGGTEIVLSCDLVVGGAEARFGLPEVTRGLLAGAGGLVRLPRQIPVRAAMEAALTGESVPADTAREWHLINRLVPAGEALATALLLAERIAANAPLSVQAGKRLVRLAAAGCSEPELWAENDEWSAALLASRDAEEGLRAFAERRPPVWTGH
ncbi:crotonase/enoyl-CoA hydratase family protein [Streptomyces sanglieri]|uniref:crotonase/enoyl-CoA hydratase family protein n=1 Tax=Streptomyces sp. Wh19 TaxID=3076629 RepID=UPI0029585130|nr:crotonase/enoyl-CoA hydratase family protein [Streptomyces sp. Wh19]MDV9194752.1 crotonase/enoyl-CoA hydratase family protein [Streptomyces sp. Wh19]